MDATEQATDQLARIMLMGSEYTLRLSGSGAKNLAALLMTAAKGNKKTKGKIRLESLLKSGKPLSVFELKKDDISQFAKEAKRYGILYTVIVEKGDKENPRADVLVKAEDAGRINRIIEKLELSVVDTDAINATVEDIKIAKEANAPHAPERDNLTKDKGESLIDDLLKKSADKEREAENPTAAKTGRPHPSEHSSDRGKPSAEGTEKGKNASTSKPEGKDSPSARDGRTPDNRRSVKQEMNDIRREREKAPKTTSPQTQTRHQQPATRRGKVKPEKGR